LVAATATVTGAVATKAKAKDCIMVDDGNEKEGAVTAGNNIIVAANASLIADTRLETASSADDNKSACVDVDDDDIASRDAANCNDDAGDADDDDDDDDDASTVAAMAVGEVLGEAAAAAPRLSKRDRLVAKRLAKANKKAAREAATRRRRQDRLYGTVEASADGSSEQADHLRSVKKGGGVEDVIGSAVLADFGSLAI
jgi:hypothetical protein